MRVWSAAAVIAFVLVLAFVLTAPHARDLGGRAASALPAPIPTVAVHDVYKKGTHTLTVQVPLPDACTSVTGQTSVVPAAASSSTDTIQIALDMPADSGICLQLPQTTTLSLTAAAGAHANIVATINGTNASTTSY